MILIGNSFNRQIFYTNIWKDENWFSNLPTENWLVFSIGQKMDNESIEKLATKCIENNVLYVCSAGQNCEWTHDIFDLTFVTKKIADGVDMDDLESDENFLMTVWDNNFSDGFWYAITTAHHPTKSIDKIVCIDYTIEGVKDHLINLIEKINNHWLPSDEEFEEPIYDKQNHV